jgi:DNA sulfur modification protein DndB
MATTIPALRGKIGSTEYFVVTMSAAEVKEKLTIPKEMEGWEDLGIEERFQREINYNRVKKHIAPYMANDDDRFYGALIVDIYNGEGVSFESLKDAAKKFEMPTIYKNASKAFGFLNFVGEEILVPLDGQHRLAAIQMAISGKDEKQKPIPEFDVNIEVAKDDVTLILIRHDQAKARKIFNKVNQYAKPTSKADNLITADDDILAVITREEIVNQLIDARLINRANTLSANQEYFSTLATIYEATKKMLEINHGKIGTTTLPDRAKQKVYRTEARKNWKIILGNIQLFKLALHDTSPSGDEKRKEIRKNFVLGRPIAQLAAITAIMRIYIYSDTSGARVSLKDACDRLNKLDWTVDNSLWQQVLMNGDKMLAGNNVVNFAGRFIAYLCGEKLETQELKALKQNYVSNFPLSEQQSKKLPKRVVK